MTSHTEIVSVTYRRGKAGERQQWDFDDWQMNQPDPDEWPEDIAGYDWRGKSVQAAHIMDERFGGVYVDLPTDWFGLKFEFVGQLFEGEECGLEWESEADGAGEVFRKWAGELKALGDGLLDAEADRRRNNAGKIDMWESVSDDQLPREVTFLTAWKYEGRKDWDGEWYSKWEMLGRIDLSKIEALIVREAA